jgi:hypothetical protein
VVAQLRCLFAQFSEMYSLASRTTSARLPLPFRAGCKLIGSRWVASFQSRRLLSPNCVLTADVQDSRNMRASESRPPMMLTMNEMVCSFRKEFIFASGMDIRRQRSAPVAISLIQLRLKSMAIM